MSFARQALETAGSYLSRNPSEIFRTLSGLLGFRLGVPLDAIRWLLERAERQGKVKHPLVTEVPPGVRVTATFDLMNTPVRGSSVMFVDRMLISSNQIRIELRLEEIWMEVIGEAQGPVAALLKSGALDLSKPGNLARYMSLPKTVVEAKDNRIVLDLMKDPKIADNVRLQRALSLLTPFLTASAMEVDRDHMAVVFRPLPQGVGAAVNAIRHQLVGPGVQRFRSLLSRNPIR